MKTRLISLAAIGVAGLTLGACDMDYGGSVPPPPPAPVEATAAEEVAVDATEALPPEPVQQPAPPPSDSGDMGDARTGEESVQPDSETVFY